MVYEEMKKLAQRRRQSESLGPTEISAMGAASKLAASLITYPQQVIRSRLQQRSSRYAMRYRTAWSAIRVTLRREGIAGLYKGLAPSMLRVMPSSAITFLVYEKVMAALCRL
uniref:Mitochondrial carrier n=2 Tax=Tetraselmis sp. GSL018 TaxID=582737 RepID=A0A061S862_9CHLO